MPHPPDAAPGEPRGASATHGAAPARPDVFVSYAREDEARVTPIVRLLADQGWDVWSDHRLDAGDLWQRKIKTALDNARCVVVLWSNASVASHWVMDEAAEGMKRGILVPVLLDEVEIPLGFRQVQAIDLSKGLGSDDRSRAFVASVAGVLGRPVVHPVVHPEAAPRWQRWARTHAPFVAALALLAAALPILLGPVGQAEIDLDVKTTEIRFESAREQDITDVLVVAGLDIEGLQAIRWPRTRSADLPPDGPRNQAIALSSNGAGGAGSVTLPGLTVPQDAHVTLASNEARRLRIAIAGSTQEISVNVEGSVRVELPQASVRDVDFGRPKPIVVQPDPRGATFTIHRAESTRPLLPAPLAVRELSLTRLDETVSPRRTEVRQLSTIVSGTVRFDPPDGAERSLGPAEQIRFTRSVGEIRALDLAEGGMLLRFRGRVGGLESCSIRTCESWMPSRLSALASRRLGWLVALGSVYLLVLLLLARRSISSVRGALAWALAFGLCAAAPARAQVNVPIDDPEESIKQLVVRVETDVGFGSGIIAGDRGGTIYIATANHVVRRGTREASTVDVRFRWMPDRPVAARLLATSDDALDLAVIAIDAAGLPIDLRTLPYDRLGDLRRLDRGDAIYLLGHPNGLPWRVNTTAERFIEARGDSLDFESTLVARGHSGGALLDEDRRLVGMLKSDQPPYGEAINIHAIARKLESWDYPVNWRLPAPQLAAGDGRTCVLTARSETRCWGFDPRFESGPVVVDFPLRTISADTHVCGLAERGQAFCAGNNADAQLGDGTTTYREGVPAAVVGGLSFESISAGEGHTCGVVTGGDVYCWGLAESGQLGMFLDERSPRPVRVPAVERFRSVSAAWGYTCGLTFAGAAYCWGGVATNLQFEGAPVTRFAPGVTFASLTTGTRQVCGIDTTGRALCWGFNDDGQLGTGTTDDDFYEEPRPVSGNHRFRSLSAGVSHTCGVTVEGEGYCWGLNSFGQLGDGTTTTRPAPTRVSGNLRFEAISAGNVHTCGLTVEGDVYCWGDTEGGGVGPVDDPMQLEPLKVMHLPPEERVPWR